MCDASKGRAGKAADGTEIRVYTKAECGSMGGTYFGNGECTKPQGGSYSWDCRGLNGMATATAPVTSGGSAGALVSSMAQSVSKSGAAMGGDMTWMWWVGGAVGAYAVYRLMNRRS